MSGDRENRIGKVFHLALQPQYDLVIEMASAVSKMSRGDLIEVVITSTGTVLCPSEIILLNNLQAVSNQFDFVCISEPYSGKNTLLFKYMGKGLPEGLSLAFSLKHIQGVIQLFKDVFNETMSLPFWRWKYDHGLGIFSPILLEKNRVVAHYGLIPRNLNFMRSKYTGLQACDVMVAKNSRGGISNSYLATLMSFGLKQFDMSAIDVSRGKPVCFFGFPHGRHLRLGERLAEYGNLGNLFSLEITSESFTRYESRLSNLPVYKLEKKERIKVCWSNAWSLMLSDTDEYVIGERDWCYGNRRYLCHPVFDYEIYTIGEESTNVVVLKKLSEECYQVIDYIGRLYEMANLIGELYGFLKQYKANVKLSFWQLERFANQYLLMANTERMKAGLTAKFIGDAEFLEREQWWIMMGDTDFL